MDATWIDVISQRFVRSADGKYVTVKYRYVFAVRTGRFGAEGWRASDSSPGRIIEYAEPELKCWMPMPSANLDRTSMPPPWEGEDAKQLDGSGI